MPGCCTIPARVAVFIATDVRPSLCRRRKSSPPSFTSEWHYRAYGGVGATKRNLTACVDRQSADQHPKGCVIAAQAHGDQTGAGSRRRWRCRTPTARWSPVMVTWPGAAGNLARHQASPVFRGKWWCCCSRACRVRAPTVPLRCHSDIRQDATAAAADRQGAGGHEVGRRARNSPPSSVTVPWLPVWLPDASR